MWIWKTEALLNYKHACRSGVRYCSISINDVSGVRKQRARPTKFPSRLVSISLSWIRTETVLCYDMSPSGLVENSVYPNSAMKSTHLRWEFINYKPYTRSAKSGESFCILICRMDAFYFCETQFTFFWTTVVVIIGQKIVCLVTQFVAKEETFPLKLTFCPTEWI
jgi:hypothetical protein